MTYSSVVSAYANPLLLNGRSILAVYSEYSFAALLLDDEEIVTLAVEEVFVGHWFEVFPICLYSFGSDYTIAWAELDEPMEVISSALLWREEWQEASVDSELFMGAGPHSTQFAGALGQAPASSPSVVKVLAGIKVAGRDGRSLVVCSSDNSPFKVDLAIDADGIERVMQFHTAHNVEITGHCQARSSQQ